MKIYISGKYDNVKKYLNCYKGLNLTLIDLMAIQSNIILQKNNSNKARKFNVVIGYEN